MLYKYLVNLKEPVDPFLFKTFRRNNQYFFLILDKTSAMYELNICNINKENNISSSHETNKINVDETNNAGIFENLIDITQQTLDLLEK